MNLPSLVVPPSDFISHISNSAQPVREAVRPFCAFENSLREIYAQDRGNKLLDDGSINLVPIFNGHEDKLTIRARDLSSESQEEKDRYLLPLPAVARKQNGARAITASLRSFRNNFNVFSESSLIDLDWNNVVVAGSAAVTALLPIDSPHCDSKRALREYYHEKLAPASDVDLFLYGLTEEEAVDKIKQIESSVRNSILYETTVVRTKYAITIASQYPCRHVQIVLRIYKNISEILAGFDVDSSCVAYDGSQVYATPRAVAAFMTQTNTVDLSRRSPSYENRLSKYSHRGFEVYCPTLDRSRIDPTIFERSFGRVLGLARLLVLERLPKPEDRDNYLAQRRQERGRPALPWNARHRTALFGNIKEQQPDDVAEWVEEDEVSNYHTFTVPYGPKFHAKKIEKLLFTKDLLLNAEWNKPKDREVHLHRHPAFFGRVTDVIDDCCGFCPEATNEDEVLVAEKEAEIYIKGRVSFVTDHPGRQQIGSFNPLTEDDWTEMAYVGNTTRLCQDIVAGNLEDVEAWCQQENADVNRRDHTGRTPLQLATICSTPVIVKCLIDHGARLVARLADGQTALHLAARRGNTEMIRHILERSARNEDEEEDKQNRLRENVRTRIKVGHTSSDSGDDSSDDSLVDDDLDSVSDSNDEMTQGSFVRVTKTQEPLADVDTSDEEPDFYDINVLAWDCPISPLHLAIMGGHIDAVKILVDTFGADIMLPIKIKDEYSREPKAAILTLVLAAKFSPDGPKMTKQLLSHGASSSQADMNENTALQFIVNNGDTAILDVLLNHDEPAAKAAVLHLSLSGYGHNPDVRTALLTAIHNRNEDMAFKLLGLDAPTIITEEIFTRAYHRKFTNASQNPDNMKQLFYTSVDQPVVMAIQNDMPKLAKQLLSVSNANTLCKNALRALARNGGSHRRFTKPEAKSILDLVRDRIKALKATLQSDEKQKQLPRPEPLEPDDCYLEGLQVNTYQYWLAHKNLERAKLMSRAMASQYKKRTEPAQKSEEDEGVSQKQAAIEHAIVAFEALELHLLELDAKTFLELYPEAVLEEPPNYNFGYGYKPHLEEAYKTTCKFLVPDINDAKFRGYMALFEAAWVGDMRTLKSLTLAPWKLREIAPELTESTDTMQPLNVAIQDDHGFSPFSLAVLRGHLAFAQVVVEIAAVQYTPSENEPKYRYSLRPHLEDIDSAESDDSNNDEDDSNIRIYSHLVDERYTVDNIAAIAASIDSRVSPAAMINWSCETWRFYESIERASSAGVRAPDLKPNVHTGYNFPAEKEYSQGHLCQLLQQTSSSLLSTLMDYAVGENNLALVKFILGIRSSLVERQEGGDGDVSNICSVGTPNFEQAVRIGRTEILGELLRLTGAELPLKRMVEKSGVDATEKPKFYQGLSVYGKKRADWAAEGRGVIPRQVIENDAPPLLRAAFEGNIESTEFFLGDCPRRRYEEFIQAHKNDTAIKALDQGPGGIRKTVAKWLEARNHLAVHAAVLAAPDKHKPAKHLEFVFNAMPQALDSKSCRYLTPLHLAFRFNRYAAAEFLIKQGADQAARDKSAENIMHHFVRVPFWADKSTVFALQGFISLLDPALPEVLLTQRSSSETGSHTPLSLLMSLRRHMGRADIERIEVILQHSKGKDLEIMNGSGDYPLHTAVRNGCTRLVKLFIQTNPSLVHRENAVGMTPLEIAETAVLRERSTSAPNLPRGDAVGRQLPSLQPREFVHKARDMDEPGIINALVACTEAAEQYPLKRKLVSLLDANEVAKRLANKKTGLEQYDIGNNDKGRDEVDDWMNKAASFARWDLIKFVREQEGKNGWGDDDSD